MKKYIKPELFFESFELSQQIAACDFDLVENTFADDQCAFFGKSEKYFFKDEMTVFLLNEACTTVTEYYCYHNAAPDKVGIFNS